MNAAEKEEYFKKYIYTLCYHTLTNRKIATINVWSNAIRIYKKATSISNFNVLRNIEFSKTTPPDTSSLWPFIDDNIIDNVRIITCFENFMKGLLLLGGFMAHKLTRKHGNLKYQQSFRPIKIEEVFTDESFEHLDTKPQEEFDVSIQTINFSSLLKPAYQAEINLPADILNILKDFNDTRNMLHFIPIDHFFIGYSTINNLSALIEFVQNIILPRLHDLDDNLNLLKQQMP